MYVYADIWLKPSQYCRVIILQLKINFFLRKRDFVPKGLRAFSGLSRQRRLGIAFTCSCMATSCLQVGAVFPTYPLTPLHAQILSFHHCLAPGDLLRCPIHLSRMCCTSNRVPVSLFSLQPDKRSLETLSLISFCLTCVSYLQKSHVPT